MNPYTLSFYEDTLEKRYREEVFNTMYLTFKINLLLVTLLNFGLIIIALITDQLVVLITNIICIISLPLVIKIVKHFPDLFDWFQLSFQTMANMMFCVVVLTKQETIGAVEGFNTYIAGYTISYFSYQANTGSRFYLKAVSFLLNFLIILIQNSFQVKKFLVFDYIFTLGTALVLVHNYRIDKVQREAFVMKLQDMRWMKSLDYAMNIGVIKCEYDTVRNSFNYIYSNQWSEKNLNLTRQDQFLDLIRYMKIFNNLLGNKGAGEQSLSHRVSKGKYSMENLMYECIHKKLANFHINAYQGILNSCVYNIKMLTAYGNVNQLTILISKENDDMQLRLLKEKVINQTNLINCFLRQKASQLKKLNNIFSSKANFIQKNLDMIRWINYNQRYLINILLYLRPKIVASMILSPRKDQIVSLSCFLENFISTLPYKKLIKMFISTAWQVQLTKLKLISIILQNLFDSIIIKKYSQDIILSVREDHIYTQQTKQSTYNFFIQARNLDIYDLMKGQLVYISPQTIDQLEKNNNLTSYAQVSSQNDSVQFPNGHSQLFNQEIGTKQQDQDQKSR